MSLCILGRHLSSSDIDLQNSTECLGTISSIGETVKGNSTSGDQTTAEISVAHQAGNIMLFDAIPVMNKRGAIEIVSS